MRAASAPRVRCAKPVALEAPCTASLHKTMLQHVIDLCRERDAWFTKTGTGFKIRRDTLTGLGRQYPLVFYRSAVFGVLGKPRKTSWSSGCRNMCCQFPSHSAGEEALLTVRGCTLWRHVALRRVSADAASRGRGRFVRRTFSGPGCCARRCPRCSLQPSMRKGSFQARTVALHSIERAEKVYFCQSKKACCQFASVSLSTIGIVVKT